MEILILPELTAVVITVDSLETHWLYKNCLSLWSSRFSIHTEHLGLTKVGILLLLRPWAQGVQALSSVWKLPKKSRFGLHFSLKVWFWVQNWRHFNLSIFKLVILDSRWSRVSWTEMVHLWHSRFSLLSSISSSRGGSLDSFNCFRIIDERGV